MAKRVILYEETKNSNTQFNPVTDIESVFHASNQTGDGSEPVENSIFTKKQETLLTLLSRINSWLYKLRALNNYEVAKSTTEAEDNDLALQKTVNRQINELRDEVGNVRNDVLGNETDISSLQQKTNYLDDIIIDMAYKMDCITDLNVVLSSSGSTFYTWYKEQSSLADASNYYEHDDKLLLLGIKVGTFDYKFYLFKIAIGNAGLATQGPIPTLLTAKDSSYIKIQDKELVDYPLPSNAYSNVINFDDDKLYIYFEASRDGLGELVSIFFKALRLSDSIGGVYARIIQGIPKQSSPKK